MNRINENPHKQVSHFLKSLVEYFVVFLFGGTAYFLIEIIWRSYSHICMFFAGGICFSLIYFFEKRLRRQSLFFRCFVYASTITAVEFVFGVIFNILLGFEIWDYSDRAFNILGQVCVLFFVLWMLLSLPAIYLCGKIQGLFDGKRKNLQKVSKIN